MTSSDEAGVPDRGTRLSAAAHIDATRLRVARRSRVREVIFGTQDGLLTTLGLVSGVGGATNDRYTVLVAGAAGAFAGLIAMGAGAYISSKSQLEVEQAEVERERVELARNPERELEELVQLFEREGLPEADARLVAEKISARPAAMLNVMTEKELRLRPDASEPLKEGLTMAAAFLLGAVVPITPWFLVSTHGSASILGLGLSPALLWSVTTTVGVLFVMGAGKSRLAHTRILVGAFEVMGIGIVAAVAGYLLGSLVPHLVGAHAGGGMSDEMLYGERQIAENELLPIPNPAPDRAYLVTHDCPEFTCLCPRSGFPDFANIRIEYVPGPSVIELKSLKLYINGYRDRHIFHESVVNVILDDLVRTVQPQWMRVVGDFNVRGNIKTVITAQHGRRPEGV